jgi:hypothetical protein
MVAIQAASINQEAFGVFVKLITAPLSDPDAMRLGNESLIADLVGENPVPVPRTSTVDLKVVDLLYKFLDLNQVPVNFEAMETMVKYCPWRGKISRGQHLENCYFLIAHETYILEERLKRFLNCISACVEDRPFPVDLKAITKGIIKEHKSFFGNIVAARGTHVHQETSVPRDIKRVGLLETQMKISDLGALAYFHRDAARKARKQWMDYARSARRGAAVLIAMALQQTRIVWETVIREELDKLAAK